MENWPNKISNQDFYFQTQQTPWTTIIQKQRFRWLGHILRLPEDTLCRQALYEFQRTTPRTRCAFISTWYNQFIKELKSRDIDTTNLELLANYRQSVNRPKRSEKKNTILLKHCEAQKGFFKVKKQI
ncbi:hypothetical protein A3Q56_01406 [Intoshia linei]|uniref:Uncharacterized protein n=1 Tax=Intoshia linei TaxID=1819745 RepID=A0A177B991_9BILA|nr:hypothetical protein A3Q56_01406 [Intoshia linei]